MSGARGTESQQQDRRNAADRAGNSRGTAGQQQDRRNFAASQRAGNVAPGVGRSYSPADRATNAPYGGMPPQQFRRSQVTVPEYDMSLHNLREMMGMMPLGPMSAMRSLGGALGVPGLAPDFEGYSGRVNAPGSYDPTNRFAGEGLLMRMNQRAGKRGLQYRGY